MPIGINLANENDLYYEDDSYLGKSNSAFDDYQQLAIAFRAKDLTERESQLTMALGLCGEAGEVAELIKKHIGHGHDLDKQKLVKELGDVLWYLAAVADNNGINLSDVASHNIEKLSARYPQNKFTSEESINRKE